MRVLVPAAARRSRRIIVDAESTRARPARALGTPRREGRRRAARGHRRRAARWHARRPRCGSGSGSGERQVVLSVVREATHKNLAAPAARGGRDPRRAAARAGDPGYPTPHEAELRGAGRRARPRRDVLPAWVSRRRARGPVRDWRAVVVFPSLYEGFGLPVLEAMARGVPVACSDRSSLPEVAGDAALLFDPDGRRTRSAAAIERLLADDARARAARATPAAGGLRAFTWERTAPSWRVASAYSPRDRGGAAKLRAAVLGNRPWGLIARNVLRRENYAAIWRMRQVAVQPRATAWRYLSRARRVPVALPGPDAAGRRGAAHVQPSRPRDRHRGLLPARLRGAARCPRRRRPGVQHRHQRAVFHDAEPRRPVPSLRAGRAERGPAAREPRRLRGPVPAHRGRSLGP